MKSPRALRVLLPVLFLTACPATGTGTNTVRPATPGPATPPAANDYVPFAGGTPGFADGKGSAARFREPNGVDVDAAGNVYVADTGNHRIRKIAPDGTVTTLAGGERGYRDGKAGEARFDSPYGLCVKRDGMIYVADTKNHRIRAVAPDGSVTTLAGEAAGDRDGKLSEARFKLPFSLALDALDGLIVADAGNHRLRRLSAAGLVETLAGRGPGYVDGPSAEALFDAPSDVALDARGRIYVADLKNHAVRELDLVAGRVRTVAGNGTAGFEDGDAARARFELPTGLAVARGGTIYVADSQNRAIRVITPDGRVTTAVRGAPGARAGVGPIDVAVDATGALAITDAANGAVVRAK